MCTRLKRHDRTLEYSFSRSMLNFLRVHHSSTILCYVIALKLPLGYWYLDMGSAESTEAFEYNEPEIIAWGITPFQSRSS